jgi:tetratricopeptide (TPR) repeat protein
MWTRRYDVAERLFDRAIAIDPTNVFPYLRMAEVYLLDSGTTTRALAFVASVASAVDSVRWLLEASVGTSWLRQRVLMPAYESSLDSQGPAVVGPTYYFANATRWEIRGDLSRARIYYDSARAVFLNRQLQQERLDSVGYRLNPAPDKVHMAYALAGLGRRQEAIRELQDWALRRAAVPDAHSGVEELELRARTYLKLGDHNAAIDDLGHLLSVPAPVSVPGLRLDPVWNPLRSNPRFQALLAKYEKP